MEFKEFCSNFNRMIKECDDDDNPFIEAADSDYVEDWIYWALSNAADAENFVATWTKEHPVPIYPTFGEYLRDMANHDKALNELRLHELLNTPISEKVAEQYKIAPLNLCDIKKYASEWL